VEPAEFMMVGNSLKSDILPVLEIGGAALHVPYQLTWMLERTDEVPAAPGRFFQLTRLRELPALLSGTQVGTA
jgi:putative hydrolase of the HAD superfamily